MPSRTHSRTSEIGYEQIKADTGTSTDTGKQTKSGSKTSERQGETKESSERVSKTQRDQTASSTGKQTNVTKTNKAFQISFTVKIRSGIQGVSSDGTQKCL